ncbi:14418_t:CDS:10 [Rhizophagus irregularis]|nr:14418_t:CDS:10 [Rhizophagus irregularis]
MRIRDSEKVSNDSNEVQEDTNNSFNHAKLPIANPLMTSSQQAKYNEVSSDLADVISGLYRLLDLCNDDDINDVVDKIIISKEYLEKLCNDMVPSSFKSISEINYTKLNSISFRLIGCYGNRNLIAKFLLNRNIIDQQLYDLLTASISINDTNKPSLRPGIYLLVMKDNLCLLIHWPEIGCYENASNPSSQIKRNMVNLHRYLTKLTDYQMCFMSDKDLESFDLNLENSVNNSDEDDETQFEFENEINNQMEDEVPLYPIVVESTTNQSFVTRQLIKKTWDLKRISSYISAKQFPDVLKTKLQDRYLLIDRNRMDMKALESFVKHGLKMEEPLIPLYEEISAAKKRNEEREIQEKNAIDKDIKIIQQIIMASTNLRAFESYFDKYTMQDNSLSQPNISDTDFERIRTKYPEIKSQIEKKIQINSKDWKKMKKRYNLTCIFIEDIREKINEASDEMTEYLAMRWIFDEEFIQELVKFESFEGYDDIKEKIINTFIKEYYKWKKDDLPQEILKSTRYNKQLKDKLKRIYEEEKKNIEKNMFDKICNEIDTKYKDGSMRLIVLNVKKSFGYFMVEYDIEELQSKQLQITIHETSLKEEDKFQIQENESHIPCPCPILLSNMNEYGISFRIDPQNYDFKKISQFDNHKFLLMLYNKKMQRIEIFFDTAQQLAQNFESHSTIKPFKILNTDENFIIAINEPKGLLAIYNTVEVKLAVFSFNDNRSRLYGCGTIKLLQWYNNSIPNIKYFLFIKDTEYLCFVENSGRARVFNLANLQFRPAVCNFPYYNLVNVLSSPDGSCIVAFTKEADSIISTDNKEQHDNDDIKEINRAYVYFFETFGGPVSKVVDLPLSFKSLEFLQISCFNNQQTHLITFDLQNGCLKSLLVKIILEKAQLRFQKCMRKKSLAFQRTNPNDLINAYKLMFEKYPIDNCIDPKQNRPLSLKIVLDIDDDAEDYGKKFEEYITKMFENLKRSTNKPALMLKEFSSSVITFQDLDVDNANFRKKFSSEYQLGEWIIQLCCLIPIQIAVTRNNLFQPLKDGLSSNENYPIEVEDGHHVDIISKNISFGWYEGIFRHFGNKKVKVISSMGEQLCGKSFMLNHLVGTTFDGSRYTEGVWMSLVNTQESIYVALDFEGLKSFERTPQEDISTMFQKFQDCAQLYESDPKLFQARLCVIIKDVPKVDKDGIIREFQSKFDQLIAEEGEDNFITRMYGGGLDIIPWPVFGEIAWFKTLSIINKKLEKQKVKYENAITFLQNIKVIMAKLKICDWSSLDESLIQIRIATFKRLLPIAISYGLEQKDSVTKQLMDRDSGKPIEDPTINFTDYMLNDVESIELLPDADIHLYDENESFAQLSEDLRDHFEKIVQSREEMSDENKWFENYAKFSNYIVERRISRVRKWYAQNTAKLPQDNSNVIYGKYEMEQKLDKLTLLWTLCGLACHQCHLKCMKNFNHEEDHDCLTNHKCNFPCQFVEVHNKKLIPKCSHKAGHEGRHICRKIKHLCGEPCNLIDKRNCQKVCSKEIGHLDGEHLCQSTRHYCGENCSLSTVTVNGDYHCPNKCIKSHEEHHELHSCEIETCPIQCPIPYCEKRCQSDHFHTFFDLHVDHFLIEPKKQLQGAFIKYIQLSERLRCNKKIPPNKSKHLGKHTHNDNGFHFCEAQCHFCGYFCILPYGHEQYDHNTRHGIDVNTKIKVFEDDASEYTSVDGQGKFTLCNLLKFLLVILVTTSDGLLGTPPYLPTGITLSFINEEQIQSNPDKTRTGFKDPYPEKQ